MGASASTSPPPTGAQLALAAGPQICSKCTDSNGGAISSGNGEPACKKALMDLKKSGSYSEAISGLGGVLGPYTTKTTYLLTGKCYDATGQVFLNADIDSLGKCQAAAVKKGGKWVTLFNGSEIQTDMIAAVDNSAKLQEIRDGFAKSATTLLTTRASEVAAQKDPAAINNAIDKLITDFNQLRANFDAEIKKESFSAIAPSEEHSRFLLMMFIMFVIIIIMAALTAIRGVSALMGLLFGGPKKSIDSVL